MAAMIQQNQQQNQHVSQDNLDSSENKRRVVTIIYGIHQIDINVDKTMTLEELRQQLSALNIPTDALVLCEGKLIKDLTEQIGEYRTIEFIKLAGVKGR